jgi:hypothetical protein
MKMRFWLPLLLATLACAMPGLSPRPTIEPLIFPTPVLETVTPMNPVNLVTATLDAGIMPVETAVPTLNAATATLSDTPIAEFSLSAEQVYYGGDCSPKEVTFSVKVSQPEKVYSVLLFVRLRNQKSGAQSAWNTGLAMRPQGEGRYEYRLRAVNVPSYKDYDPAWLQFQFVLTDSRGDVIGRSQVYTDRIKFQRLCP